MTVFDDSGNAIPENPYPADIINLSLGGSGGSCPSDYQSLVTQLTSMGVLVVASAGNESGPVDIPGNCPGVLAVAGLRNVGTKVGYSSLGRRSGLERLPGIASTLPRAVPACAPLTRRQRSFDRPFNQQLYRPDQHEFRNQLLGTHCLRHRGADALRKCQSHAATDCAHQGQRDSVPAALGFGAVRGGFQLECGMCLHHRYVRRRHDQCVQGRESRAESHIGGENPRGLYRRHRDLRRQRKRRRLRRDDCELCMVEDRRGNHQFRSGERPSEYHGHGHGNSQSRDHRFRRQYRYGGGAYQREQRKHQRALCGRHERKCLHQPHDRDAGSAHGQRGLFAGYRCGECARRARDHFRQYQWFCTDPVRNHSFLAGRSGPGPAGSGEHLRGRRADAEQYERCVTLSGANIPANGSCDVPSA